MTKATFYSINCPKCKVLEIKLKQKKVDYEVVSDVEKIKEKNILTLPMLEVDDVLYNFADAIKFLNGLEG